MAYRTFRMSDLNASQPKGFALFEAVNIKAESDTKRQLFTGLIVINSLPEPLLFAI